MGDKVSGICLSGLLCRVKEFLYCRQTRHGDVFRTGKSVQIKSDWAKWHYGPPGNKRAEFNCLLAQNEVKRTIDTPGGGI